MPRTNMRIYTVPREYLQAFFPNENNLKYQIPVVMDDTKVAELYPFKSIERFTDMVELPVYKKALDDTLPLSVIIDHHYKTKLEIKGTNRELYVRNYLVKNAEASYTNLALEKLLDKISKADL